VVVNGSSSDALPVLSGVPQGLVIEPLLFLIYIDGIKSITLYPDSHLTLYTDDMLLYRRRPISTSADYVHLQEDINRIGCGPMLTTYSFLQFNIEKCKVMHEGNQKTDQYAATSIIPSWPATTGGGFLQISRSPHVIRFLSAFKS